MNPRVYPSNAEVVSYCSHEIVVSAVSKFIPNMRTTVDAGFRCLACQKPSGVNLGHSDTFYCGCGINYQLFGNGLHIWGKYNAPQDAIETTCSEIVEDEAVEGPQDHLALQAYIAS